MLTHSKVTSSDRQDRSLIYLVYRASTGSERVLRGWAFVTARTWRPAGVWRTVIWRFIWMTGFVYCFWKRGVLLPLLLIARGVSAPESKQLTVKHFNEQLAHPSTSRRLRVTRRFAFVGAVSVKLEGSQKGQQWLCSSHESTWDVVYWTASAAFCFLHFHLWTPLVFPNSHQSHVAQSPTNLLSPWKWWFLNPTVPLLWKTQRNEQVDSVLL